MFVPASDGDNLATYIDQTLTRYFLFRVWSTTVQHLFNICCLSEAGTKQVRIFPRTLPEVNVPPPPNNPGFPPSRSSYPSLPSYPPIYPPGGDGRCGADVAEA
ncbi:hypothetical protein [Sphingobacterium siyangense]|uniref:hypothetical protein n=1 Tax=Sphingobacterium siyangense TaxID=459529 RepID=UPI001963E55C|nr:hypothetical protein [Sphingobacterium siyangense]QRY56593.1 hypothetical protein JVX97_21650 [Sphingobacterium siyangense]